MGLDMYLECNSRKLAQEVFDAQVSAGYESADSFHRSNGIICYWRKANAIHSWFVGNVQGGCDDCKSYRVEPEQLVELLKTCRKVRASVELVPGKVDAGYVFSEDGGVKREFRDGCVVADPSIAEELLPTRSGFFFGDTAYDEYYVDDLDKTIFVLDAILSRIQPGGRFGWDHVLPSEPDWCVKFSYQSSW